MSTFLIAAPQALTTAAADVGAIGEAVRQATAAAAPTAAIMPAAADEVSAAIAVLFGTVGKEYQAASAQAAEFQAQFVRALAAAGGSYAAMEAASVDVLGSLEEQVLAAINAPTNLLLGRPLIGPGTDGAAGTGAAGGPGGLLWGRGCGRGVS
ncbi:hypothetical protein A9W98_00490, partial [Mycobacterium gordonae]